MAEIDLDSPELYFNRELSWLEFNDRVLREGLSESAPLMERLKFLSIVSTNLDEFFMIRVAGLKQQQAAGVARRGIAGMLPSQQLDGIGKRVHRLAAEQSHGIRQVVDALAAQGIRVLMPEELSPKQQRFADSYFETEVLPILTPLAVASLHPFPVLTRRELNLALAICDPQNEEEWKLAIVPIPEVLSRFVSLPAEEGLQLILLENVIARRACRLFPGFKVLARALFRLTRDADVSVDDDDAGDLLQVMTDVVLERRRRRVVRLEVSADADPRILNWLTEWCGLSEDDVYRIDGMMDASALMSLALRPGFEHLRYPETAEQPPRDLLGEGDLWQTLQEHDVLLCHPFDSFEPVVSMLRMAAEDANVLAIKQTLYRTSGDSPIIDALKKAAQNGKQVTVLVELKARFDEARNIGWARQLEDAGCHVIYGIAGLKTHGKALMILRRETGGVRKYVHLSTGNYNERTARLYCDIGLMTSDREIGLDLSAFFNLITGYSQDIGWHKLAIAPKILRTRLVDMIDREIRASTPDEPGLILAKMNSLEDKTLIQALYRASRAGVQVRLNVRGICCLRPGVEGVSDNIEVVSIIDRYLEHSRICYFRNGGHSEVYLSSADWMVRNLDKRLEILFPVTQPNLKARLLGIMNTCMADNTKARRLLPDGTWTPVPRTGAPVRAQEKLYQETVDAAHAQEQAPMEFRPLTREE